VEARKHVQLPAQVCSLSCIIYALWCYKVNQMVERLYVCILFHGKKTNFSFNMLKVQVKMRTKSKKKLRSKKSYAVHVHLWTMNHTSGSSGPECRLGSRPNCCAVVYNSCAINIQRNARNVRNEPKKVRNQRTRNATNAADAVSYIIYKKTASNSFNVV